MSTLLGLPIDVAYHLVSALAGALAPLPGGLAAAAAIIAFTIMVRLLVLPLGYYAVRGERARARLAPRVQDLYRRHSKQPERLQRELSALYAGEGAGMFSGCLPALLQVPFFAVVYRLFLSGTIGGSPNVLLRQHLLGAPLGSHWLTGLGPWSSQGLVFAAVFGLLVLVAWLSARGPAPGTAVRDGGRRCRRAAGRRPVLADHDGVGGGRTGRLPPPGPGATRPANFAPSPRAPTPAYPIRSST